MNILHECLPKYATIFSSILRWLANTPDYVIFLFTASNNGLNFTHLSLGSMCLLSHTWMKDLAFLNLFLGTNSLTKEQDTSSSSNQYMLNWSDIIKRHSHNGYETAKICLVNFKCWSFFCLAYCILESKNNSSTSASKYITWISPVHWFLSILDGHFEDFVGLVFIPFFKCCSLTFPFPTKGDITYFTVIF